MKKIISIIALFVVTSFMTPSLWAATAKEIDAGADATLERFYTEVSGGKQLAKDAKGVLIFPGVFKAGIGIGGEYGEGVLRMGWGQKEYYSTAAASIGFQLGAQKKSIVILFMQDEALKKFQYSSGWKAGVDASIAVVTVGAGGAMDTSKLKEPILGFIFNQKGLMYNLSLEGAKFTKIKK
jgi:lipid-binding SYLF domain-containing protein